MQRQTKLTYIMFECSNYIKYTISQIFISSNQWPVRHINGIHNTYGAFQEENIHQSHLYDSFLGSQLYIYATKSKLYTHQHGLSWGHILLLSQSKFHKNRPASTLLDPRTLTCSLSYLHTIDCTQPVILKHLAALLCSGIWDLFFPTFSSWMNRNFHPY